MSAGEYFLKPCNSPYFGTVVLEILQKLGNEDVERLVGHAIIIQKVAQVFTHFLKSSK